jgi:aspartate carbamoyltransferase catalytic subunit
MQLKHLVESQQLEPETIKSLFEEADELRDSVRSSFLKGKILATLFYEPSTRTRLSFEAAMLRMGGEVISTENAGEFSSAVKGESIEDTIRIIGAYSDAIVMRHKENGAAQKAVEVSPVPIINGGDGSGQHPTQALLDLYTIEREIGRTSNIRVAMVGDLKHGRTVRSLSYLLGKYSGIEIVFIAPPNLQIGEDIKEYLDRHEVVWSESSELDRHLPETDVVYMTRIQKERMPMEDFIAARDVMKITRENLDLLRPEARLMHPLPHVEEIVLPIETEQSDPRVAYFRQAENGLYIRMALLEHLLA